MPKIIYLYDKDNKVHIGRVTREDGHIRLDIDGDFYCTCDNLHELNEELRNHSMYRVVQREEA